MLSLKLLWNILRGKSRPPPAVEMEQVERDLNDIEPAIKDLERAAEFRKWQRERDLRGYRR